MSIKPILMNTEMVRAILDGRKTVTRRVVKPQPPEGAKLVIGKNKNLGYSFDEAIEHPGPDDRRIYNAPYRPGDILYVRETWRVWRAHRYDANADVQFKAGGDGVRVCFANGGTDSIDREDYDRFLEKWYPNGRWRSPTCMPREAARIFLRVTDVRVERLQSITGDGCAMEGVPLFAGVVGEREKYYLDAFAQLWDSTIKPADRERYGWAASPWVWVIAFERCEKPEEAGT